MAWENRGRYYTRSTRIGGRVFREYVGCDEVANFIANCDRLEREQRRAKAAVMKAARDSDRAQEEAMADYFKNVDAVLAEAFVAAGYHQHRGQWRRIRGTTESRS